MKSDYCTRKLLLRGLFKQREVCFAYTCTHTYTRARSRLSHVLGRPNHHWWCRRCEQSWYLWSEWVLIITHNRMLGNCKIQSDKKWEEKMRVHTQTHTPKPSCDIRMYLIHIFSNKRTILILFVLLVFVFSFFRLRFHCYRILKL